MSVVVAFAAGVLVGAAGLGLWHLRAVGASRVAAAAAQAGRRTEAQLLDSFRALSGEALAASNEQFLALADVRFAQLEQAAAHEASGRQVAVVNLVEPVGAKLAELGARIESVERQRAADLGSVRAMVGSLREATDRLQAETHTLASAMHDSRARGAWGELQLRRVIELAGMVEHCDFSEQVVIAGDEGHLRPDVVVHLPQGKRIVIDAKVPLAAYLEAMAASDPAVADAKLADHGRAMVHHVDALARRDYARLVDGSIDVVVLFVPGESFLSAAHRARPALFDEAIGRGVFLATPATLIALLKAVSYGWRQERLAESAADVARLGSELYERIAVFADHLNGVGTSLTTAVERYNKAVASMEGRLLVTARRLHGLGVDTSREVPTPTTADVAARHTVSVELQAESESAPALVDGGRG